MGWHGDEDCKFRSGWCAGQTVALEKRIVARFGAASTVCGEEFSALFSKRMATACFADESGGSLCGYVLRDAQMQSGMQLLHTKRAGRFQRGVTDEGDDPAAETDPKRDRFHRDYGRGADAATRHRGTGGSGAVRMQVPLTAADYQRDAAGSQ